MRKPKSHRRLIALLAILLAVLLFSCHKHHKYQPELRNVLELTTEAGDGGGTGFEVVAPSGKVFTVTNRHMCLGGATYAELGSRRIPLHILEISKTTDLCVLEGISGYSGLELSDSELQADDVVDFWGFAYLQNITHSQGFYVSRLIGPFDLMLKLDSVENTDYVTAVALPGNSGSPVFNQDGKVVGVVFATIPDMANRALIVPLDDLRAFLRVY